MPRAYPARGALHPVHYYCAAFAAILPLDTLLNGERRPTINTELT